MQRGPGRPVCRATMRCDVRETVRVMLVLLVGLVVALTHHTTHAATSGAWNTAYGNCSEPCGGGLQFTIVTCVDGLTGLVVNESQCNVSTKPPITSLGCNLSPCLESWRPDGRCGASFPAPDGSEASTCDPLGRSHCCNLNTNLCGSSADDCTCDACIDFAPGALNHSHTPNSSPSGAALSTPLIGLIAGVGSAALVGSAIFIGLRVRRRMRRKKRKSERDKYAVRTPPTAAAAPPSDVFSPAEAAAVAESSGAQSARRSRGSIAPAPSTSQSPSPEIDDGVSVPALRISEPLIPPLLAVASAAAAAAASPQSTARLPAVSPREVEFDGENEAAPGETTHASSGSATGANRPLHINVAVIPEEDELNQGGGARSQDEFDPVLFGGSSKGSAMRGSDRTSESTVVGHATLPSSSSPPHARRDSARLYTTSAASAATAAAPVVIHISEDLPSSNEGAPLLPDAAPDSAQVQLATPLVPSKPIRPRALPPLGLTPPVLASPSPSPSAAPVGLDLIDRNQTLSICTAAAAASQPHSPNHSARSPVRRGSTGGPHLDVSYAGGSPRSAGGSGRRSLFVAPSTPSPPRVRPPLGHERFSPPLLSRPRLPSLSPPALSLPVALAVPLSAVEGGGLRAADRAEPPHDHDDTESTAEGALPAGATACTICLTSRADAMAIPCGHSSFCYVCLTRWSSTSSPSASSSPAARGTQCPVCRHSVAQVVRMSADDVRRRDAAAAASESGSPRSPQSS